MLQGLLVAAAVASPKHELLRLMQDVDADPVVAVSCDPIGPMTDLLQTVALPAFNPSQAPAGSWMSFLNPDRLVGAGIDPEASVSVLIFDDREIVVDLGFLGTEAQANVLVASLLGLDASMRERFSWDEGRLVVGGRRLPPNLVDVAWQDHRLTVRAGVPNARGATSLRSIVERSNADGGCALTFDGDLPQSARAQSEGRDPTRITAMVHLPMADGAPAKVLFHTHEPVPTALTTTPQAPIGGSTKERPAVLMSIGVALGDLLLDPTLRTTFQMQEQDVVELLSRVRFGHGTTVAFFADEPRLGFVANLDATRADGRAVGPRRARRLLQRALSRGGLGAERLSATELHVALEQSDVWIATREGGLVVGSRRDRVREAADGQGTTWIRPAFTNLAHAHPVALRSEGVSTRQIPPVAADLGIRTHEGLWELTFGVHVDDSRKAATHTALAATIGSIVLPRVLAEPGEPRH
ncbi:MAG: hypothetical protein AAGA48_02595 [Myxococcota bacterium]